MHPCPDCSDRAADIVGAVVALLDERPDDADLIYSQSPHSTDSLLHAATQLLRTALVVLCGETGEDALDYAKWLAQNFATAAAEGGNDARP